MKRAHEDRNGAAGAASSGGGSGGGSGEDNDEDMGLSLKPVLDEKTGKPSLMQVEFEFKDPAPIDEISVFRMLNHDRSVWKAFDPKGVGRAVNAQVAVGTVIKAGGDTDAYAFVTALNVNTHKHVLQKALDYILKNCIDSTKRKVLELALKDEKRPTGMLVNERLINSMRFVLFVLLLFLPFFFVYLSRVFSHLSLSCRRPSLERT